MSPVLLRRAEAHHSRAEPMWPNLRHLLGTEPIDEVITWKNKTFDRWDEMKHQLMSSATVLQQPWPVVSLSELGELLGTRWDVAAIRESSVPQCTVNSPLGTNHSAANVSAGRGCGRVSRFLTPVGGASRTKRWERLIYMWGLEQGLKGFPTGAVFLPPPTCQRVSFAMWPITRKSGVPRRSHRWCRWGEGGCGVKAPPSGWVSKKILSQCAEKLHVNALRIYFWWQRQRLVDASQTTHRHSPLIGSTVITRIDITSFAERYVHIS